MFVGKAFKHSTFSKSMPIVEGIKRMIDRQLEEAKKEEKQKKKEVAKLFEEKARLHVIISGHVQGIFFRAFVKKAANVYGVTGWVKNNADGTVEVIAEGVKEKLEKLLNSCKMGPPAAKIQNVKPEWQKWQGEFTNFEVR